MSQQASAPRPASHHSPTTTAAPDSQRDTNLPSGTASCPSPTNPQAARGTQRLLVRDEQHGMLYAETGTTDGHGAHGEEMDRPKHGSAANSPKAAASIATSETIPETITNATADERGQATAAAMMTSIDDRANQPTPPRPFGVQNILNPSDPQPTHSRGSTPTRGDVHMGSGPSNESRPLPRTRPNSASSPRLGPLAGGLAGSQGRMQGHAQYVSQLGSAGRPPVFHGHGLPAMAEPSQQPPPTASSAMAAPPTARSPATGFSSLAGGPSADRESSPSLGHASHSSFGAPRRILTAKPPRRSSLGRGLPAMGSTANQPPSFSRGSMGLSEAPPVPPIPPTLLHQSRSAPNIAPGSYLPPHVTQGGSMHGISGFPPNTKVSIPSPRSFSQPFFPGDSAGPGGSYGDGRGSRSHTPAAESQASLPPAPISRDQQQQQQQQHQGHGQPQSRFPPPQGHGHYHGPGPSHASGRISSASNVAAGGNDGPWQSPRMMAGSSGSQISMGGMGGLGGGRSMSLSDGQQFITITPSFGDEIHVPVDVHQASKQADEKRLRNAGASARFRARKKEKDREVQVGLQRLESQTRELQRRIHELEVQRDFYRNQRNRLRHFISQDPNLRELVGSEPASPASTSFSGGSYGAEGYAAEGSPMASSEDPQQQHQQHQQQQQQHQQRQQHQSQQNPQPHPHHPQQQQQYSHQSRQGTPVHTQPPMYPPMSAAPVSSGPPVHSSAALDSASDLERPARRRRTDSGPNPDYFGPAYTTSAPPPSLTSSLPPLSHASHAGHAGGPPHPGLQNMSPSPLSGSPSNPRLPPLRLDTPGSNPGSVSLTAGTPTPEPIPGVPSIPAPQYLMGAANPATYTRPYDNAGWAADAPSPHPQNRAPPGHGYQR